VNRHATDYWEACRLARRAAYLRGLDRHSEADAAEARALVLSGYEAPREIVFTSLAQESRR